MQIAMAGFRSTRGFEPTGHDTVAHLQRVAVTERGVPEAQVVVLDGAFEAQRVLGRNPVRFLLEVLDGLARARARAQQLD